MFTTSRLPDLEISRQEREGRSDEGSNVINYQIKGVAMKMKVIADRSGKILATHRPTSGGGDAPTGMRVVMEVGHEH